MLGGLSGFGLSVTVDGAYSSSGKISLLNGHMPVTLNVIYCCNFARVCTHPTIHGSIVVVSGPYTVLSKGCKQWKV